MEEQEVKLVRLCPKCGTETTDYDADFRCSVCGQPTKEQVIAGETGMGPAPPPALAAEVGRPERKKRMCHAYGKEIDMNARVCQYCGIDIPDSRVTESTTTALAAICGIFGLHGLGHLTLGKIPIGFLILFAGLALIGGIVACAITYWWYFESAYIALIAILAVAYIGLFVWQVMDASASARKRNLDYENHAIA